MKTKERILAVALELFNEQGTHSVTTNHIAEAMGISPGNLYYHYANKEEIIRGLYEQIAHATDQLYDLKNAPTNLTELERLLEANYELLWEYRFFYRELIALTQRDPQLKRRYESVRKRGFEGFKELVKHFTTLGVLRPPKDPKAFQRLAETCWLISEFWPPFLETGGERLTKPRLKSGAAVMLQVLEPYLIR